MPKWDSNPRSQCCTGNIKGGGKGRPVSINDVTTACILSTTTKVLSRSLWGRYGGQASWQKRSPDMPPPLYFFWPGANWGKTRARNWQQSPTRVCKHHGPKPLLWLSGGQRNGRSLLSVAVFGRTELRLRSLDSYWSALLLLYDWTHQILFLKSKVIIYMYLVKLQNNVLHIGTSH
jgi:hypothetical protein